ncbi:hypothetical protein KU6B_41970 [Mameliella alba]|uniref:Uncharacterized protein n=2 Tax=Roseobacteraceae TaxID=2854170 RepID=A0A0B3SXS4_9RHOB|nr:hypothetical protein [Mameliella alba]MDD9733351.1 hypothetical protein [Mameliella sp. AT18]ODM48592.1 hypothetical protein A9320_02600 [Ruegeria sp. PBVC088]KHQ55219.1 hypothetical protein OA50_00255 [Mameliella alba]OWV49147.1 hypothetical protein CDZ96_06790 [Mameliella alba]PTR40863.1 hypothetical protein LX94_01317 [Mameliella alba]
MSPLSFKIAFGFCVLIAALNLAMVSVGLATQPIEIVLNSHIPSFALNALLWGGLAVCIFYLHVWALGFAAALCAKVALSIWQAATFDGTPLRDEYLAGYSMTILIQLASVAFVTEFVTRAWRKGYLV